MYPIAQFVHLATLALLTGFMAVVQWTLIPAQNRLDGAAYATLERGMNEVLEYLTPALMISTLLAGAVVLYFNWSGPALVRTLYGLGLALVAVMVVSTLIVNAPVNFAIDDWDLARLPENWQSLRDRWEMGHALRAYVGLAALSSALAATVLSRR